jgi:putative oxidoreductase
VRAVDADRLAREFFRNRTGGQFALISGVIRALAGLVFSYFGITKLGDQSGTAAQFYAMGIPGTAIPFLVPLWETLGGLSLLVGLGTRLVAGLFALEMVGAALATLRVMDGQASFLLLPLLMLAVMVFLLWAGPARFALDNPLAGWLGRLLGGRTPRRRAGTPGTGPRAHLTHGPRLDPDPRTGDGPTPPPGTGPPPPGTGPAERPRLRRPREVPPVGSPADDQPTERVPAPDPPTRIHRPLAEQPTEVQRAVPEQPTVRRAVPEQPGRIRRRVPGQQLPGFRRHAAPEQHLAGPAVDDLPTDPTGERNGPPVRDHAPRRHRRG